MDLADQLRASEQLLKALDEDKTMTISVSRQDVTQREIGYLKKEIEFLKDVLSFASC